MISEPALMIFKTWPSPNSAFFVARILPLLAPPSIRTADPHALRRRLQERVSGDLGRRTATVLWTQAEPQPVVLRQFWIDARVRLAVLFARRLLRSRVEEELQFDLRMPAVLLPKLAHKPGVALGNQTILTEHALDSWRYAL